MVSLRAHALSFAFEGARPLFSKVDISLSSGVVGVVGENGAGKSTLLDLISRERVPDAGVLEILPRGARVIRTSQRVEICPGEASLLRDDPGRMGARLRALFSLAVGDLDRWSELSPGERRRWQIASAIHAEPDILLLDEPTHHVDLEIRDQLVASLSAFAGLCLVVSHDRDLLDRVTSSTLRVHRGQVTQYDLRYSDARAAWQIESDAIANERAACAASVKKLEARLAARRADQAAADHNRSTRSRSKGPRDSDARSALAKGRVTSAERKIGRDVSVIRDSLQTASDELGQLRVERERGRSVLAGYTPAPRRRLASICTERITAGDRELLRDVSLVVERDDRVWIRGPNGVGKTTLLTTLLREASLPAERTMYLSQEMTELEARELLHRVRSLAPIERGQVLSMVAALGVSPDKILSSSNPSPGEARKLALAFGLRRQVWLLALDEPTHHLDLPSVERLERALVDFEGAILLVSHDPRFARSTCKTSWEICDRRVSLVTLHEEAIEG